MHCFCRKITITITIPPSACFPCVCAWYWPQSPSSPPPLFPIAVIVSQGLRSVPRQRAPKRRNSQLHVPRQEPFPLPAHSVWPAVPCLRTSHVPFLFPMKQDGYGICLRASQVNWSGKDRLAQEWWHEEVHATSQHSAYERKILSSVQKRNRQRN